MIRNKLTSAKFLQDDQQRTGNVNDLLKPTCRKQLLCSEPVIHRDTTPQINYTKALIKTYLLVSLGSLLGMLEWSVLVDRSVMLVLLVVLDSLHVQHFLASITRGDKSQ